LKGANGRTAGSKEGKEERKQVKEWKKEKGCLLPATGRRAEEGHAPDGFVFRFATAHDRHILHPDKKANPQKKTMEKSSHENTGNQVLTKTNKHSSHDTI
jgi:hypothetical protein